MEFQIPLSIPPLPNPIRIGDKIFLIGSCFTEHIGDRLSELKFPCIQNPHGILFDSQSVAASLSSYVDGREYLESDLFYMNEVWQSWAHHSRYSHTNQNKCLELINDSQKRANAFLADSSWLIITLGSSYSYRLIDSDLPVANCHRAPAQSFRKHLMSTAETFELLANSLEKIRQFNPKIKVLLTISPVRHIRDGVVANNRSKARLIEAVHQLVEWKDWIYYFPAYDLLIDVLRDYRFYDLDMVHPNYQATRYVMERFMESCLDTREKNVLEEIQQLVMARKHRPTHPQTQAHVKFLHSQEIKLLKLLEQYPDLDFREELAYFRSEND